MLEFGVVCSFVKHRMNTILFKMSTASLRLNLSQFLCFTLLHENRENK